MDENSTANTPQASQSLLKNYQQSNRLIDFSTLRNKIDNKEDFSIVYSHFMIEQDSIIKGAFRPVVSHQNRKILGIEQSNVSIKV